MIEYQKIQTMFKRGENNKIVEGDWSVPELGYLCDNLWEFTEKVDGTNIRVSWDGHRRRFGGRTERAMIPSLLLEVLEDMFENDGFCAHFGTRKDGTESNVILFGEGYGPKIQKGGGRYRDDPSFVLFDVLIDGWWLGRKDVLDVANKFNIDAVPVIGEGTLQQAIDRVRAGISSHWGDFIAEGIVARPKVQLFNRKGYRIITKIKAKDFRK